MCATATGSVDRIANFRFLAHCLAFTDNRNELAQFIKEGRVDWEYVITVASHHLITPTLYWSLLKKDLLPDLPQELVIYLETIFRLNRERNEKILQQLAEITTSLNQIGVEPVLLKGVAHLITDLYENNGMRVISDIDLLVPEERLMDCVRQMEIAGRCIIEQADKEQIDMTSHHYYPLGRIGDLASLELHKAIISNPYHHLLNTEEIVQNSQKVELTGTHIKLPTHLHQVQHHFVHAYMHHRQSRLDLRRLYDFALLIRLTKDEEWKKLEQFFIVHREIRALYDYLTLTQHLFAFSHPTIPQSGFQIEPFLYNHLYSSWFIRTEGLKHHLITMLYNLRQDPRKLSKLFKLAWYKQKIGFIQKLVDRKW